MEEQIDIISVEAKFIDTKNIKILKNLDDSDVEIDKIYNYKDELICEKDNNLIQENKDTVIKSLEQVLSNENHTENNKFLS